MLHQLPSRRGTIFRNLWLKRYTCSTKAQTTELEEKRGKKVHKKQKQGRTVRVCGYGNYGDWPHLHTKVVKALKNLRTRCSKITNGPTNLIYFEKDDHDVAKYTKKEVRVNWVGQQLCT